MKEQASRFCFSNSLTSQLQLETYSEHSEHLPSWLQRALTPRISLWRIFHYHNKAIACSWGKKNKWQIKHTTLKKPHVIDIIYIHNHYFVIHLAYLWWTGECLKAETCKAMQQNRQSPNCWQRTWVLHFNPQHLYTSDEFGAHATTKHLSAKHNWTAIVRLKIPLRSHTPGVMQYLEKPE